MKLNNLLRKPIVAIILAIFLGVLVGGFVFVVAGYNPVQAYGIMLSEIITKPKNLSQVVVNAVPLIFTGLAFSFTSQAGLFNIGIEGQFVLGALTGALAGYYLPLPPVVHPIVILALAFIIGGLWGALAGVLKSKFGIHEVISTIMLNWIAHYFNNFIVNIPSIKVEGTVHSPKILDSAKITFFSTEWKRSEAGREFILNNPILGDIVRTDLGFGIILAIIFAIILW
ncbi:MAG: ABC transporter permease, partial [Neofamilia sp.]